jgi:ABC-type transport system substrate-binding protein
MEESGYWARFSRWRLGRRAFLGAAAAGLGAVAVACGSKNKAGNTTSAGTTAASPTAASASRQSATPRGGTPPPSATKPKIGGSATIGYGLNPSSLDPQLGNSGGDAYYWRAIFDTLVGTDRNYQPTPALSLARTWETPDPTTLIFQLRDGVTLHDGTPLTSDLVSWNIQRVQNPQLKSTAAASFATVDRVETPDPLTARFVLKSPDSALLGLLADRGGAIISRQAAEKFGDKFGANPVGAGPFMFEEWVPNNYVKLKAFPSYWRKDASGNRLPYLDELTIRIVPDPTAALASVRAGELQLAGLAAKDVSSVQNDSSLTLLRFAGGSVASVLVFNLDKPDVQDPRVRLAICYGVDPEAVNRAVYFGQNTVAQGGMWPINTWVYQPVPGRPAYDPNKAKQLLAQAGHSNGVNVQMITWTDDPTQVQQATQYQSQLKQIGVNVQIEQFTVGVATANFYSNSRDDLYSTGWSRYPEPDWNASLMYTPSGFYNPMKREIDPQLTKLVEQGRQEYDQEKRKQIYNQINDIVINKYTYYVPMIYGTNLVVATKKILGTDTLFTGDGKWQYPYLSLAS